MEKEKTILDYDTVALDEAQDAVIIIDQTLLPGRIELIALHTAQEIWDAIYLLKVRGAPAIGVAAALGIYLLANRIETEDFEKFYEKFTEYKEYLDSSRPTAVNLSWALKRMDAVAVKAGREEHKTVAKVKEILHDEALQIRAEDVEVCRKIGEFGLELVKPGDGILTHCNAGQLATVKYGTATAPIYLGQEKGYNFHVFADETRPLLSTEKSLPLHTLIQKEMMKHSISDFEIMAPVGSRESLAAAIQAGADSIYFGIENLNMRARSANTFTIDDLREIARTCDEHGMKSYLTVNTIIYDHDIPLMRTIVDAAKAAGISAVIAADVAVMSYARQIGQEVHLSTQLNISNVEALRFYAQFADVVVLARELNLEQVAEIYRHIREENICGPSGEQIRIEMFCHGALCMAVSGKCYLSLHEMNHSANRGACMQVCRRSYTVRDKETDVELEVDNQYIMSPKDLKTIHFMNKMLDAGVRVFKIEGRARGPEYVRTVVECYKEAIRSYLDDTFTDEKIARWDERLKTVFNRGFWDGYYLGQRLGEWTKNYGSAATERKIYVGKGIRYFSNIGVAEFLVEAAEVSVGDKLLITGPTTGAEFVTLDEARVDLKPVQTVKKGQHFSMKSVKIRPSDKLYKLVSVEELKKFKGLDVEKQRG